MKLQNNIVFIVNRSSIIGKDQLIRTTKEEAKITKANMKSETIEAP